METQFTKRTYTSLQATLLTKAMLIAGIAFIIIGAGSWGFSYLFYNTIITGPFYVGFPIFLVMLLSGMIVSILWSMNMMKNGSVALTIICYLFFMASMSVAFGWVFAVAMINLNAWWLPVLFAIVGGIFLLSLLISKAMTINSVLSMGKIIASCAIVMSVLFLVFLILMIVSACVWNAGVWMATDAFCSMIMMIMTVISFLYIIIDLWQIGKASEFESLSGEQVPWVITWFYGFKLLTDLVNILFIILLWVLRFARA